LCVAIAAIRQLSVQANLGNVVLGDQFGHGYSLIVR
jgi:hypothetical protein